MSLFPFNRETKRDYIEDPFNNYCYICRGSADYTCRKCERRVCKRHMHLDDLCDHCSREEGW